MVHIARIAQQRRGSFDTEVWPVLGLDPRFRVTACCAPNLSQHDGASTELVCEMAAPISNRRREHDRNNLTKEVVTGTICGIFVSTISAEEPCGNTNAQTPCLHLVPTQKPSVGRPSATVWCLRFGRRRHDGPDSAPNPVDPQGAHHQR